MNKTLKKFIIGNAIVALCVIGFLIYAFLTVGKEGYECVFYRSTGLICPGCGGTRAVISLLKLDFLSAIKYNVAVPFGAFVYLYYNIRGIIEAKRENLEYFSKQKYVLCIVLAVIMILNFVVKNVLLLGFNINFMG